MANRKTKKKDSEFMARVSKEWEDLKYYMSNDFKRSRGSDGKSKASTCWWYRALFLFWVLAALSVIPIIVFYFVAIIKLDVGAQLVYAIVPLVLWSAAAGTMYITINPKFNGK